MIRLEIKSLRGLPAEGGLLPLKHTANLRGFSVPEVSRHTYLKLPGGSSGEREENKQTKTKPKKTENSGGERIPVGKHQGNQAKGSSRFSA